MRANTRITVLLAIVTLLTSTLHSQIYYRTEQSDEAQYNLGFQEGKKAGHGVSQVSWALKGFGCAFLTCGIGGCMVWTQTRHSGEVPVDVPMGKDPQYVMGYIEGYKAVTRSNKQSAAITGCVIGTLLDAAIIGVITSGYAKTFQEVWDDLWN